MSSYQNLIQNINNLPSIATLLKEHHILAKRSLGQNFLFNPSITEKIVAQSSYNLENSIIVEVGPGGGLLTRELLKSGAFVIAIEHDRRFEPILFQLQQASNFRLVVIYGDAMKIELSQDFIKNIILQNQQYGWNSCILENQKNIKYSIIANLPYNISILLLYKWLEQLPYICQIIVMLQNEVVQRITNLPRSKDYGKLSVIMQSFFDTKSCFTVSPKAFTPAPKVESAILLMKNDSFLIEDNRDMVQVKKDSGTFLLPSSQTEEKNIKFDEKVFLTNLHLYRHLLSISFAHPRKLLYSNLRRGYVDNIEFLVHCDNFLKNHFTSSPRPGELGIKEFFGIMEGYVF